MRENRTKLLLIGEFPPPYGGMAVQAQYLCAALSAQPDIDLRLIRRNAVTGIFDRVRGLRGVARFAAFLARCAFRVPLCDTVYIFSNSYLNFYLYTIPPVVLGKALGKKTVINYHGGSAREFFSKKTSFAARAVLRSADAVTVQSAFLKGIFKELGIGCLIVPNIVDLGRFKFKIRESFAPSMIITRHLEAEYGIDTAIKAAAIVKKAYPGAFLRVCGDGSQRAILEALALSEGLQGSVEFTGNVENSRLAQFYGEADIFLNASLTDNLPVAILEAFACGLPVVSTLSGGIAYLIEEGRTGLAFKENDARAMASRIVELIQNPGLGRALCENARGTLENYSAAGALKAWREALEYVNKGRCGS